MFCAMNVYIHAFYKLSLAVSVRVVALVLLGCVCHGEINNIACTNLDPCKWRCTESSMTLDFDLTPMLQGQKPAPLLKGIPDSTGSGATFSYDPCRSYNDSAGCNNVSMCQNSQFAVGLFGSAELMNVTVHPDSLSLKYHGPPSNRQGSECLRVGLVSFYCNESVVELINSSVLESPLCTYSLNITTKYACSRVTPITTTTQPLPAPQKKLSIGSILLIVLLVCIIVYLVGGFLFLRFVRDARGVEQIPNYGFWILIPGLVKDGFVFTCTKIGICKGDQVYEKI